MRTLSLGTERIFVLHRQPGNGISHLQRKTGIPAAINTGDDQPTSFVPMAITVLRALQS